MSTAHHSKTQFTIQELADRWSVHPLTIRRRIRRGDIRCLRHGRQIVRIEIAEIERLEREARA